MSQAIALKLPSLKRLDELFALDIESGVLTRKIRAANRTNPGDIAGYLDRHGYLNVTVDSTHYKVHRIIYFMATGNDLGNNHIDHVNGDRADNRMTNLRAVTNSRNMMNQRKLRKDNRSGYRVVYYNLQCKKMVCADWHWNEKNVSRVICKQG